MEKILVFTHRLDLALRLVDTTSGRNVSGRNVTVLADGEPIRFSEKQDQVLVFQNLGKRKFRMKILSPAFEEAETEVDLDALGRGLPLLEIHLVPSEQYPGGATFFTLQGLLPGIGELAAVRVGDKACLMREFDPRKRLAKVFNPHHLALDRVYYALLDPDRGIYEPFRILRLVDDQTLKVDRILEMSFKNYFPVTPEVLGKTRPDGSYCLRLRDEGQDARWVIRWKINGENRFRMVNFREGVPLPLEEGGG